MKHKIIRAATVPGSLNSFCKGVLKELSKDYEVVALSSPGVALKEIEVREGVRTVAVSMYRRMSLLKDLISLISLIKVFYKEKPYMVHSMTPKAGLLCMLAAWITRVPRRVHTFTGLVWPTETGLKRKILILTDKITCVCATHIIPEGQGVLNDLQLHITKKHMKVLGHGNVKGVDMVRFSRRLEVIEKARTLRKEDCFTFVFVGRLVGDKGINELVSVFERLNISYPQTRLLLVGNFETALDPLKKSSLNIIEKNLSIKCVGPKYEDDLLAYYAASDCFVFPSYREGFPNTVLEAGAMGLPSIVTDINGSREIISNGYNGLVIPSKDESLLYKAMEQMIINQEETKKMALNARTLIEDRFEQSFVFKCLCDFYREII